MCEKCKELDDRIEHYQKLAKSIADERTVAGIREIVTEMEAERASLHREQET